jgi:hypothetical protein
MITITTRVGLNPIIALMSSIGNRVSLTKALGGLQHDHPRVRSRCGGLVFRKLERDPEKKIDKQDTNKHARKMLHDLPWDPTASAKQ